MVVASPSVFSFLFFSPYGNGDSNSAAIKRQGIENEQRQREKFQQEKITSAQKKNRSHTHI